MQLVTLTESEATAILLLLKSMTYDGLGGEEGMELKTTLLSLWKRIEESSPDCDAEQFELWCQLSKPSWVNEKAESSGR